MIDSDLKVEMEKINRNLVGILHKTESPWRAFFNGILRGLGSVAGVAIAILLIGWILNVMGVIPGFKEQASQLKNMWQDTLDQAKKIR